MKKDTEMRAAAKRFADFWCGKGYEKGESQMFWTMLLRDVYGVEHPEEYLTFEEQVKLDHTSFIDVMIKPTHVMIEQKSLDKDLRAPIRQSDGTLLSPFQQAKRYSSELPYSERPRWILTCNFGEFLVYDMEKPNGEPESILLSDLPKEYYRLSFLVDSGSEHIKKETEVSLQAGELIGKFYDEILKQYKNPDSEETLRSLNMLCVRIVFCLYAEDAGVFGGHSMFCDYLKSFNLRDTRRALTDLFKVLDTREEDRDPYIDDALAAFPYVNGGLFRDENIEIPNFTEEIRELLLSNASEGFDWSQISPTIFGALFESTLNPETRRHGGMHYTSIENIHKVTDPLFLDDLRDELEQIKETKALKDRLKKAETFRDKLASLTFLDPACGSGNFLTETYVSLRRMENEVLRMRFENQIAFDTGDIIKVSIGQFYGIEVNDFAVTVAKTALWIAENQMMKETEAIIEASLDFLPLKSYANIIEGNALRVNWEDLVPREKLNYIIGNPPFVGYSLQNAEQKKDILSIYIDEKGKPYKTAGKIDYVSGWYFKAAQLMEGSRTKTAFVSTNSITQGEQVAGVWKPLYDRFNIHIDFAHSTFRWDSEASIKAHVHCVIVGFGTVENNAPKKLYSSDRVQLVDNINAYLISAPDIFIESRNKPIFDVPEMVYGNKPTDGGFLFISHDEYEDLIKKEPSVLKYVRQIYGATEYINNKARYCLWLVGISPTELRNSPFIKERVEKVRKFRLSSTKDATRISADTPYLFQEIRQPDSQYIIVPRHSSEKRKYIPFGFVNPDIIVNDAVQIIPDATLYHFGVLTSNVHMAWTRAVCGRLKSDYRYSKDIVYNNFPWPTPTDEQKAKIEKTAQAILDARAKYSDCSFADMYGEEMYLYSDLLKAHRENDRAVMQAYGFPVKNDFTESMCVAELMKMYRKLTESNAENGRKNKK